MNFYRVIDDIRSYLYNRGEDMDYIESICEEAAEDLSGLIADSVSAALAEAENRGLESDMKDFAGDLTAVQSGDTFRIVTKSGKTNYSSPERKMLNSLLKNAKTAKDGSRYARIPIRDKKGPATNSMDVSKQRQAILEEQKAEIQADISQRGIGRDIGKAARDYASRFANPRSSDKTHSGSERSSTIRTVSSKQDPNSQWVIPAKDADATSILEDVNNQLVQSIQDAMRAVYERYVQ